VEKIPWSDGKQQTTYTFRIFLATWAKRLSWKETASIFGTSWDTVFRAIQWVVYWGIAHREISQVNAIGIDEIQYRKGHNYLTMVYQIDKDCRRLLYVARERTEGSLRGFFSVISDETLQSLKYICSDMWPAYLNVIKESVPNAAHVLDRFHVMRKISEKIDRVRAQEVRQLKQDGYEPVLTHSRWCLLKRPENLTESQSLKMQELLKYNLKSVKAYLMREDFQRFWTYCGKAWAAKFLEQWCQRAKQSRIGPMQEAARTLLKHKDLILSWFSADGAISNGIVEGFNNKAKLAMRKAYGFKSYEKIEIALYHQLGSLPEPESTHRFC
jgi:transposase